MNILLWVLQVVAALLYGSSGVMKVFMFDKISHDVRSFGALPRGAWMALGLLELVCTVGLIVPGAREPGVHLGARRVPRDHAHHHERRAGPSHGVRRVRPVCTEATSLEVR